MVWFYGISTIIGYLMPNSLYTYKQTIQFSLSSQFSSIWLIDRALSSATTPGKSIPVSDRNQGSLRIPQILAISGASLLDCLMSYQDTRWGSLTPLQRCSRCIPQPQSTGPKGQCILGWVRSFAIFRYGETQLSCSWCFCRGR